MAEFRVRRGRHVEGRRVYKKGEVVETDRDLVAVHGKEKFEEVGSPVEAARAARVERKAKAAAKAAAAAVPEVDPGEESPPTVGVSTDRPLPRGTVGGPEHGVPDGEEEVLTSEDNPDGPPGDDDALSDIDADLEDEEVPAAAPAKKKATAKKASKRARTKKARRNRE
jgi:hypothetical protein